MRARPLVAFVICMAAFTVPSVRAQSLEDQLLGAPAGAVRIAFRAREGVCGAGDRIFWLGSRSDDDWHHVCEPGPVRVQFEKSDARVTRIRTYIGGSWRPRADVMDLGEVSAQQASEFLLDVALMASASVAEDAIMAAAIADAPDPWPRLLELARDYSLSDTVRKNAIFWLGQSAAREATRGLVEIVEGEREKSEMQKAAVFALSRREDAERVDQLIRVARTHSNPEVVRAAFFWLAESERGQALDLFEEILLERSR